MLKSITTQTFLKIRKCISCLLIACIIVSCFTLQTDAIYATPKSSSASDSEYVKTVNLVYRNSGFESAKTENEGSKIRYQAEIKQGESLTTQIIVKNKGKKNLRFKIGIIPKKADSLWAGTNINIASEDGNIFSGTMNEFNKGSYSFDSEASLYVSLTPPKNIPSEENKYEIEYKVTAINGKKEINHTSFVYEYDLNKVFDNLIKVCLGLCVVLLLILIITRKKYGKDISFFKTKITCLGVLIVGLSLNCLGIQMNVMKDDSMNPKIKENAVIISKTCNTEKLKKNDIVLYRTQQGNFAVVGEIEKIEGGVIYINDNEGKSGDVDVQPSSIEGKYYLSIPGIGKVVRLISDNLFSR